MRTPARLLATGALLALVIVSVLAPASAARAQEVPLLTKSVDLDTFVQDTATLIDSIKESDANGARAIAARLPPAWRVRDDGHEIIISTNWIAGSLLQGATHPKDWEKTRTTLLARLKVLSGQASSLQDDEDADNPASKPTAARAALREVLARGEFKQRDEAQQEDTMRRRFIRWLANLLDRLPISSRTTMAFSKVFAWIVAIGAFIALVIYLLRARRPSRTIMPLAIEAPRPTSAEWVARAYAALRQGDAREALHCGYHAVLFRLEEQGVWRVDESRTPREYVHLLPATDARRAALVDLTRHFEQTWYGSRAADGPGLVAQLEAFGCRAPSKPAI